MKRPPHRFLMIIALLLLHIVANLNTNPVAAQTTDATSDQSALLALKSQITGDPKKFLRTNWSITTSVCNWVGVTCSPRHFRVTALNLSYMDLTGTIPPNLGNLSFLDTLSCMYNRFHGTLPHELTRLRRLKLINFANNNLTGNIPAWFGSLSKLQAFRLNGNLFSGSIPTAIWNLSALQIINLNENQLSGSIPREIKNLTMLKGIDLGYNRFTGSIPDEIGDLQNLQELFLNSNNLNGSIPSLIFNMSTIIAISLVGNQFSGSLPPSIGLGVPNLEEFYVGRNQLSGAIPNYISKSSSKLWRLDMSTNSFTGFIPSTLCALTRLELLNLAGNNLRIDTSTPEANVFSCLNNLRNLTILAFAGNPLNSTLPVSIGNLSTSLLLLHLHYCNISGNIPNEISNLGSLTDLDLGHNHFNGSIPKTIGGLRNLQGLRLTDNKFQGHIPKELCQLNNLAELHLGNNELSGSLLSCIGHVVNLRELSLESNLLTSTIPSTLWRLKDILYLNLSSNLLNGSLSEDVQKLKVVTVLDISNNHLSGSLPVSIGGLKDLVNLSLANNNLEGHIPSSYGDIVSAELLDLSKNSLSGVIPKSFEVLKHLKHLNLSFNRLQGEIPTGGPFQHFSAQSFVSNGPLCGAARFGVPECKNNTRKASNSKLKFIISGIISAILLMAMASVLILRKKRKVEVATETTILSPLHWRRFSHLELLRATNGFDKSNLLGTGGFGSVYKGTMSDGIDVAVKVFNIQIEGGFKSFDTECEVLSNILHRNLVKVISCCSQLDFKALVLQYMPNGSLENLLYSQNSSLNILQRLNIMIDVAMALEYLHHDSSIPIIHCDVKPSNILLDDDMVAHVADFGITKLLGEGDSMVLTMTLATVGYMAPEFGTDGIVSTRGDVYSFGIVLMETFTKRKPTDEMFGGEMNLKQWIANSLTPDGAIVEVVDFDLLGTEEDRDFVSMRDCILSVMGLALACSTELPEERISMKDVAATLKKMKIKFLKDCGGVRL